MVKRTRFSSTQSLASQSSKGSYGKRTARTKGTAQKSLVNYKAPLYFPKWGFPRRMYIAHKYVEQVTLTSTTSSVGTHVIKCNGMYDPNHTGSGHQPMYFDNCAAIYDHFTIVKSMFRAKVTPAAQYSAASTVTLYVDDDTTSAVTLPAAAEMAGGQIQVFPPNCTDTIHHMRNNWSARGTFGGDPLSNDNLQGTGTSDPTELSYYTLQVQANSGATQSFYATVEVLYYAIWDELKTQDIN